VADAVRTESKEAVQLLVSRIVHLSRTTNRKMVQNLWWAAGYNVAASFRIVIVLDLPLASTGA
jgi:cation transport ATPase